MFPVRVGHPAFVAPATVLACTWQGKRLLLLQKTSQEAHRSTAPERTYIAIRLTGRRSRYTGRVITAWAMIPEVAQHVRALDVMNTWAVYRRIIVGTQPSTSESRCWDPSVCGGKIAPK